MQRPIPPRAVYGLIIVAVVFLFVYLMRPQQEQFKSGNSTTNYKSNHKSEWRKIIDSNKDNSLLSSNVYQERYNLIKSPQGINPFYVITKENQFPYADGDRAQLYVTKPIYDHYCKPGSNYIVLDVGALYGDFGLNAAAHGCKVVIAEPQPEYAGIIKQSIAVNGFSNHAEVLPVAITDKESSLYFKEGSHDGNAQFDNSGSGLKVRATSLDILMAQDSVEVAVLKIDVEGYDPTVLKSASKLIKAGRVKMVIMEWTPWMNEAGKGPWDTSLLRSIEQLAPNSNVLKIYSLHRTEGSCFGPINDIFQRYYETNLGRHLQTDLLIVFDENISKLLPECRPWDGIALA